GPEAGKCLAYSLPTIAQHFQSNSNGNFIPITVFHLADSCFSFHRENSSWVIRFRMRLQTKHPISALLSPAFTYRVFRSPTRITKPSIHFTKVNARLEPGIAIAVFMSAVWTR